MQRSITLFLLVLAVSAKINAQFQITVNQTEPFSPDDVVGSVVGSDNSVYLCFNDGDYSATSDVVVVKFSECGDTLWTRVYNSGSDDIAKGIFIDGNDNIYIGGNYENKPFARKYSSNGNVLYTTQISITQGADIYDVALSNAGEIYMAGRIPTGSQGYNTYLVKLNTSGSSVYTRSYNSSGTNDDYIEKIGLTNNYVYGFGKGGASNMGVLYDVSGNFQWANTSLTHVPQKVITDASHNAYFANGDRIAKITTTNVVSWNLFAPFSYTTPGNNVSMNDMMLISNDLYCTGWTSPSGGQKRMHTIKVNTTSGSRTWIKNYINTTGDEDLADDMGMRIFKTGVDTISVTGIINTGVSNVEGVGLVQYNAAGALIGTQLITNSMNSYLASCQGYDDDFFFIHGNLRFSRLVYLPSDFSLITFPDNYFCSQDDSTQLIATIPSGSSFSWTPSIYLNDSTILNPFAKWNTFGDKTFTINLNQCDGSKSTLVQRKVTPSSQVRVNGIPYSTNSMINICANDTLKLNGPNLSDLYYWYRVGDPGFTQVLTGADTLIVDTAGVYYADVYTGFCTNTTISITVNQDDGVIFIGNDTSICDGNNLLLDAGTYLSYNWSTGETSQTILVDSAAEYIVNVVQLGGCPATGTIELTLDTIPQIQLDTNYDVCIGDSLVLDAGDNMLSYSWGGMSSNQTYTYLGGGASFSLIVIDSNGCSNSQYIGISDLNLPSLFLGNDTTICFGQNVVLSASPGMDSYLWSTTDTTQNITVTIEGSYSVTITSNNGCTNSDTIFIDTIDCNTTSLFKLDETDNFLVYPNPSSGFFNYSSTYQLTAIRIFDASGRTIFNKLNPASIGGINVTNYNKGVYLIKATQSNNKEVIKQLIIN